MRTVWRIPNSGIFDFFRDVLGSLFLIPCSLFDSQAKTLFREAY